MKTVRDHLDREVTYEYPPKKIISLCPSITETLFSINLANEVIGRTRYCTYPEDTVKKAHIVGGTKDMKLDVIHELKPDLIIVEKEENTKEMVEILEKHYPVYVTEVQSYQEALCMVEDLGKLTDREEEALKLVEKIKESFEDFLEVTPKRVAYAVWKKPYMVVGKNTYINSMLEKLGFVNPFVNFEGRYPAITKEDFQKAELDYLFLSTEPYPFKEKHFEEFLEFLPAVQPKIIDGEMFWYGARMLLAASYFKNFFAENNLK